MGETDITLTRRAAVFSGAAAVGCLLSGSASRFALLGSTPPADPRALRERLYASLNDGQRALVCLPIDHPARQVTNTSPILTRPHLGSYLRADQRELVFALAGTMFSPTGRDTFAPTLAVDVGGLEACSLVFYGRPGESGFQLSLNGGHLHLRSSEADASAVAFGGAIAYGQQQGNGRFKVEGNSFAFQSDLANAVYAALPPAQRAAARVADEVEERVLQAQGEGGRFLGLPVRDMADAPRAAMKTLLEGIFGAFSAASRAGAWSNLEHNGGVERLHLALFEKKGFYADRKTFAELSPAERAARPEPYFQVWRVEGPGTVLHFKGHPHVHAYCNVVRDPARQNVGPVLAHLGATLEGEALRGFVQRALVAATGAEAA